MLALRAELMLSLVLTASSARLFPRPTQDSSDDNEGMVSSADSSPPEGGERGRGQAAILDGGLPFAPSPRLRPPRPAAASLQWSAFLGLQRRRGSPAKGAGRPPPGPFLGPRSSFHSAAPGGSVAARRGSTDRARLRAAGLQANRENGGGLQIRKTTVYGVWGAPTFIARDKKRIAHGRWESSGQHAEDHPSREVPSDSAWGSGDDPQKVPTPNARTWGPSIPAGKHDAQTRQRTAEEAWRRVMEKGRGLAEEIVLPLTEHEATRSNCRTVPFVQNVSHPQCSTVTVQNQLCFGQCSSFFIPGAEQRLYRSCSRCFPSRRRKTVVLLECVGQLVVSKDVTLVEECKCDLDKEPPLEN
uniref:uncharacterized protein n=1 Tax=Pristiophorus japonicus TaxID=55135 RepID=UPI00398F48C0